MKINLIPLYKKRLLMIIKKDIFFKINWIPFYKKRLLLTIKKDIFYQNKFDTVI